MTISSGICIKGLFNDFDPSAAVSYEQMDIQLICLDAWLDIIQENAKHTSTTSVDMYTLLMGRIK